MYRFLSAGAAFLLMSGLALAEVESGIATPDVVGQCELVATGATEDPNPNAGQCIGAAQQYIDVLMVSGAATADVDQKLIDLVAELAPLAAADKICNEFDDEVARAIRLTSDSVSSEETKAQIVEIADTVAACDSGETAAIGEEISPV